MVIVIRKISFVLSFLLLSFLLFSCNKYSEVSFPERIGELTLKKSEVINKSKLLINQPLLNQSKKLKKITTADYKELVISVFEYENEITAFSEYSISRETEYKIFNDGLKYNANGKTVLLLNKSIVVIEGDKYSELVNYTPETSIELKKKDKHMIKHSEKLLFNENDDFPFFSQILIKDFLFENVTFSSYESYKELKSEERNKLLTFIKTQNIIKESDNKIFFKLKEEREENLFMFNTKTNKIYFQFNESDINTINKI